MAEKPNKWSREEGFFAANRADIFVGLIAALCSVVFILMVVTQWNMADMVQDYFEQQAKSLPAPPPRQPDIQSKPGETGMYLYPDKAAPAQKSQ